MSSDYYSGSPNPLRHYVGILNNAGNLAAGVQASRLVTLKTALPRPFSRITQFWSASVVVDAIEANVEYVAEVDNTLSTQTQVSVSYKNVGTAAGTAQVAVMVFGFDLADCI